MDICSVNAQSSHGDGLFITVIGLIGSKELKKRFCQVFFLAPRERSYYVQNDMFRYIDEHDG